MSAYLFVHFTSDKEEKENIYFSVSRDGLHWKDLGGENPVLTSDVGTKGIRDPFMVYDEKTKKYFILATDLKTGPEADWYGYSHKGSRSILVWESADLLHWEEKGLKELAVKNAGCAWAPEAVYCRERGEWLVFFASLVDEKQRIYAAFTKDFEKFGETFEYIEMPRDIIDTTIVWDNGYYYRFSKDECTKCIIIQRAKELLSEHFEDVYCEALDKFEGLEGPEIYYLDDRKEWCLIADQYRSKKGYLPFLADSLEKADFRMLDAGEYSMDARKKRHGGVIKISDEEYERLLKGIK